ncbi:MAG: tyrosine-protein phosphatase [Candidatus Binataceae bacterium]
MVVDFELLRKIGGCNFRDLGGHPAKDGRQVRSAMVYRSAHLANVPEESPLRLLKLRTLVTLQSRLEVRHLGPPKPEFLQSGVRWEHIPIGDPWFQEDGFHRIASKPGDEHLVILTEFRDNWRSFFKLLATGDVYPLLFHCSAGRDRTGVGAAALLELLGVSRERILADFLESNTTFPRMLLTDRQLAPIFALIDEAGGIESFMRDRIGLTSDDIAAVREGLLEES